MRRILALCILAVVPALLVGEEKKEAKAAPNTLTKEEIAAGWLLLFDGETTFGWKIEGEAKVEKGVLILGGSSATKASFRSHFGQFDLEVSVSAEGKGAVSLTTGSGKPSVMKSGDSTALSVDNSREPALPLSPIVVNVPADTRVRLSDIRLRPKPLTRLFNGKDLAGWKVFTGDKKREKSQFTVTKDGHLNVKDGPGDIQTEKTFDDFVLQLECISNGKHLNSGIFFRAIPGEYWMGYEAQIRNEFTDKPTQKYAVESFDPKSHKSLGKKEVMSTAVDYGTGAIYRRVPARKAVSKDGEWFTLTVVARGRHFATWVNGVQQVDWTDNREAGKNGRNNYRDEAGAISIQGHDKTTDLSFRNIRIAELKREKK